MNEWKEIVIGDIGKVITGNTPPTTNRALYGGPYPFIKPTDMEKDSRYVKNWEEAYSEQAFQRYKNAYIPKGATGVVTIGTVGEKLFQADRPCFTNQSVNVVVPSNDYDNDFVYYLLKYNLVKVQNANPGTASGRDHVSKSNFSSILVTVPNDKKIQNQIGSILSSYDEIIDNNKRRIALLEQTAEQIYKEWFVRLRFPGYENADFEKGVPQNWQIKTIKDFGKVVTGKTPSTFETRYYGGKYPFIKTPDMRGNIFAIQTEESLSEDGFNSQKSQIIPENSIFVNCIGAGAGLVSITAKTSMTNQQIHSIILKKQSELEFLFFVCRGLKTMIEMVGSTGATMTNVSKGKFEKLKLIKPSDDLIEEFSKITKPMFLQIRNLMEQQVLLKQTRDLLLPRLISGKLMVKEAEKELVTNSQPK